MSEIKNEAESSDEENEIESEDGENSDDDVLSFESYNSGSEEDESLGFEDDSDNYVETESDGSEAVESDQNNETEEKEVENQPKIPPHSEIFGKKTFKQLQKEQRREELRSKKDLRKLELLEEIDTSKAIKDSLRNPEDGYLSKISQPSTSKAASEDPKPEENEEAESSKKNEYEDGDTSDEEDIRNTVGNIPMHWYDDYKHIGYDWDGKKIIKPPQRDQLDDFLKKMEDPNFWRTVKDPQTGQDVVMTDEDVQLIKRIMKQKNPDQTFDNYAPWIEWFTSEVEQLPIRNVPDSKASFLPSKVEKKKIGRLVHSLKMGFMKTQAEIEKERLANKGPKFYMLWETDTEREKMRRIHDHVVAPKRALPGHAESYNPPPEYLFDEQELKEWESHAEEPHKRKLHFVPQKYKSLRQVPNYDVSLRIIEFTSISNFFLPLTISEIHS